MTDNIVIEKQEIDYSPVENVEKNETKKCCFVITPIGDTNSMTRRHIEGVIDSAIIPVAKEKGYNVRVAHREHGQGLITEDIINLICDADIVIANLTGLNPNVMFEVALRYCTDKPIIHICESGTNLPFDIKDQRTIFYTNDMLGVKELKQDLENKLNSVNHEEKNRNIITATRKNKVLIEAVAQSGEISQFNVLMNELNGIKKMVNEQKNENDLLNSNVKKMYDFDLTYLGEDEFYSACDKLVNDLNGFSFVESINDNEKINKISLKIYAEPIKSIKIKKAIKFWEFIEDDDIIPF